MTTLAQFIWAIGQQESGGNYTRVNSGTGALGKYQILPENLPSWLTQAGQQQMTPQQFLNNPSAQDAVANTILGGYYSRYGAAGAAAMWYSGQPDPNVTYGNPSVSDYVKQVLNRMSSAPGINSTQTTTNTGGVTDTSFTSDIGGAISSGILAGFKSAIGPTLKWAMWFAETGLGISIMLVGLFLLIKQTEAFESVKNLVGLVRVA